jgi:hypothetical protein
MILDGGSRSVDFPLGGLTDNSLLRLPAAFQSKQTCSCYFQVRCCSLLSSMSERLCSPSIIGFASLT